MKRVGVTGHTGKIGSLLLQRADFVKLDLRLEDVDSIKRALEANPVDYIVNCAAISSIDECEENKERAHTINYHGLRNLHRVFGSDILQISTEQVYGESFFPPTEKVLPQMRPPVNTYGWTKLGAEVFSWAFGGKILRLSRTVEMTDQDINGYVVALTKDQEISVPTFFNRNYIHREFVADAIEYHINNWFDMPQIVNYGGKSRTSMYNFIWQLCADMGLETDLVKKRHSYNPRQSPRPKNSGLNVGLAAHLGFPIHDLEDTIQRLIKQ